MEFYDVAFLGIIFVGLLCELVLIYIALHLEIQELRDDLRNYPPRR